MRRFDAADKTEGVFHLATPRRSHDCTAAMHTPLPSRVQNRKSSMRANVFRFAPESGHRAMQSACPFRANSRPMGDNAKKIAVHREWTPASRGHHVKLTLPV